MITVESLDQIPPLQKPIALTIGVFDGVHLGHQRLFEELKKQGTAVVLTFTNHPLEILCPDKAPIPIFSLTERLELFKSCGIAMTITLPFTLELSQTPYDLFLSTIYAALPFSTLVGGEDIRLGHLGKGNAANIQKLSKTLGFETLFLPKFKINGEAVSSRLIRKLMNDHQFDQAQALLGHLKGKAWQDSHVEL